MITHYVVCEIDGKGRPVVMFSYSPSRREDMCKYVLSNKQAIIPYAVDVDEDDPGVVNYKEINVLDPVLIQPPTPPAYTDYPIEDAK